ncbi:endonuclease/exonuclease/phosphatase family protein [Verrucomicrobiota bacterium]
MTIITLLFLLAGASRAEEPIKVATLNVNWGISTASNTVKTIHIAKPDIILIQEPSPQMESGLKNALSKKYPHSHFKGPDHGYNYYADRFGILSKHPFDARFLPHTKDGAFGALIALVRWGKKNIQVVNVHLDPPRLLDTDHPLRSLKDFADREKTRSAEIKTIYAALTPDIPTVIAGDFNSLAGSPTINLMTNFGFIDTHTFQTNRPPKNTWQGDVSGIPLSLRIDYVFCDKSFEPIRAQVIGCKSSDHSLVLSELRLKTQDRQSPRDNSLKAAPKE